MEGGGGVIWRYGWKECTIETVRNDRYQSNYITPEIFVTEYETKHRSNKSQHEHNIKNREIWTIWFFTPTKRGNTWSADSKVTFLYFFIPYLEVTFATSELKVRVRQKSPSQQKGQKTCKIMPGFWLVSWGGYSAPATLLLKIYEQWKIGPRKVVYGVCWGWNTAHVIWGLFHIPWNKDPYKTTSIVESRRCFFFRGSY